MQGKLFIWLLMFLGVRLAQTQCHYSCASCLGGFYTQCTNCSIGSTFTPINGVLPPFGLCTQQTYGSPNFLGIFTLLIAMAASLFFKSQLLFYFILSFQTLAIISLLEAAWNSSLNILLGSTQYFMIFSVMGYQAKSPDYILSTRYLYRLDQFIKTISINANSPFIFTLALLSLAFMLFLQIWKYASKSNCMTQNLQSQFLLVGRSFFLLTMQEMALILAIGLRFDSMDGSKIVLVVTYVLGWLYFVVMVNLDPLPYFKSKQIQNIAIAKRIVLPIVVVLPYSHQYLVFAFALLLNIMEALLLMKVTSAKLRSFIYRLFENLCVLMLASYYLVDRVMNAQNSSNIASIISTIIFSLYLACFSFQVFYSAKKRLFPSADFSGEEQFEIQKGESELIERHDTLMLTKDNEVVEDQNQVKSKKSLIEDIEDVQQKNKKIFSTEKRGKKFRVKTGYP